MKRNLTLVLFLTTIISGFSQQPNTKFGEISDAEWAMTYCDFDSTASAVLLVDQGFVDFKSDNANFHYHQRIKLFDETAYKYASFQLAYYRIENRERITNLKAFTYLRQADGTVKKIEVEEVHEENLNKYWAWKKFTFPSLEPGAIIEFSYTLITNRLQNLKPWFFQGEIPVLYSEFKMAKSSDLQYSIIGSGQQFSEKYADGNLNNKWVLEKLPGYADEKFVISPKDFLENLRFQLSYYIAGGRRNHVLSTWEKLREEVLTSYRMFIKAGKGNKDLEALIANENDPLVKIKKIFEYMKENYTWDGYNGIVTDGKMKAFNKQKSGDVADLNIYLLGMLRMAGIEADPLLISTRQNGKPLMNFPLLRQFNKVICHVQLENEELFLDLGRDNNYLPYNLAPYEDLNFFGLLLQPEKAEWIEIPPSVNNEVIKFISIDLANMEGFYKGRYSGYVAAEIRKSNQRNEPIFDTDYLEGVVGQEITLLMEEKKIKNEDELEKPFSIQIPLELGDFEEDDFLYFIPMDWTEYGQNPFAEEQRVLPIEFHYGKNIQHAINVIPPDGYVIDELPEDLGLKLPGNLESFTYSAKEGFKGDVLINFSFQQNVVFLAPEAYPYLREIYAQMSEKLGEAIVFKRK